MRRILAKIAENPYSFWLCVVVLSLIIVYPNCRSSEKAEPKEEKIEPSPPPKLTAEQLNEGWLLLFDGESTFGWRAESKADWLAQGNMLTVTGDVPGMLRTTTQWADYQLDLEFRGNADASGGVLLRTSPKPKDVGADCYEINIGASDNVYSTGSLVKRREADAKYVPGRWTRLSVTAKGGRIRISLDGKEVLDYTDPRPLGRGYIGLDYNAGQIAFRNIHIKPLGMESLFNGKDLSGWRTHPDPKMIIEASVTETGELNVKKGRGQLETEQSFGDFILSLQCRTNAKGLNSGVFFRCIPEDKMMGYECQIDNSFEEGDRTKPKDWGTGGIFKRVAARKVVPDDLAWFTKTIIAQGPHIAVWVDGIQVTDWTDTRKPDDNPRRGLRLEAGTIMLQAHDETTDVLFRNIQALEMPPRRSE